MPGGARLTRRAPSTSRLQCRSPPVLAAVHHGEVVAHHTGEPVGTLALAVTALQGLIHLTIFAVFRFFAPAPRRHPG
jgi:hypothetical protein